MSCAGAGPRVYVNIHTPPWEAVRQAALSERLYRLESPSHHAACSLALLPLSFPPQVGWWTRRTGFLSVPSHLRFQ